jgi:hypothetical protein
MRSIWRAREVSNLSWSHPHAPVFKRATLGSSSGRSFETSRVDGQGERAARVSHANGAGRRGPRE